MKQLLVAVINDTVAALRTKGALPADGPSDFAVEVPKGAGQGDWSSNVALVLAKSARKPPIEVAELLLSSLVDSKGVVATAERAGPGFLNFTLRPWAFHQVALDVLQAGDAYGRQPTAATGKRVLVEFVSANPTGPLHVGHARGAFVGDAVARLLKAAGYAVETEYYLNDFGGQMEALGRAVYGRYRELLGEAVDGPLQYPGLYVMDIARDWHAAVGDEFRDAPESVWLRAATAYGNAACLHLIRRTLKAAGIVHDRFISESSLHHEGKVVAVVDEFRRRGATYQAAEGRRRAGGERVRAEGSKAAGHSDRQRGGTFLMTSSWQENGKYVLKDDEDRILLRHDGSSVYLTADLAYHKGKFDREFDMAVDVWGADHAGHVPRLQSGMRILGIDDTKLRIVAVQMVRILRGGEEVRLSKRRGEVFELEDLLEEVGPDVCRFIFLSRSANAQFDFDLDAVREASKDNPVYYLQYGYARCAGILRKAAERGIDWQAPTTLAALASLELPEERALLKGMSQLPDVVKSAAEKLEPHQVLHYAHELIAQFHSYYTTTKADPIIGTNAAKTRARLTLVVALKQTLGAAFGILGIHAPERMETLSDA